MGKSYVDVFIFLVMCLCTLISGNVNLNFLIYIFEEPFHKLVLQNYKVFQGSAIVRTSLDSQKRLFLRVTEVTSCEVCTNDSTLNKQHVIGEGQHPNWDQCRFTRGIGGGGRGEGRGHRRGMVREEEQRANVKSWWG